jgi:hypothetical protein
MQSKPLRYQLALHTLSPLARHYRPQKLKKWWVSIWLDCLYLQGV